MQNKEEAFMATKQAVYCYIHGNKIQDYEPIGEAGTRTLNAMYQIINNAQNSTENKISSNIQINRETQEWKQDELEEKYISKIFSISAGANIENYKIKIENMQELKEIKITDLQNTIKSEFRANEKFKILVPIQNMKESGSFKLTVEGKVQTKPILYGIAPNTKKQDYALTASTYEDGNGEENEEYPENETKIIILKQDSQTKQKIEGVEFELLDEDKKVIYTELKTDKEGKIEIKHLIPGRYYLKETKAKEGYENYEGLIEIEISLHEQYTVKVDNNKEEKPKIEVEKTKKSKQVTNQKTLPVTGM